MSQHDILFGILEFQSNARSIQVGASDDIRGLRISPCWKFLWNLLLLGLPRRVSHQNTSQISIPLGVLARVSNIGSINIPREFILHFKWCLSEEFLRLAISALSQLEINNFKSSIYRRAWYSMIFEVHESPCLTLSEFLTRVEEDTASIFNLFRKLDNVRIPQIDKRNWHCFDLWLLGISFCRRTFLCKKSRGWSEIKPTT